MEPLKMEALNNQQICKFYNSKEGCKKGDQCNFQHTEKSSDKLPMDQTNCRFYATGKGCLKGDECPFLHSTDSRVKNVPCRFGSSCNKGDTCSYMHTNMNTNVNNTNNTNNQELKYIPCKFGNKCKKRESCDYNHVKSCNFNDSCKNANCTFGHFMNKPGILCQATGICCRENCFLDHL